MTLSRSREPEPSAAFVSISTTDSASSRNNAISCAPRVGGIDSSNRIISASARFKYKDYRVEGPDRYKVMTLATDEFIRRFLIHVLPKGFHRIRHYGLFAKAACADNIARARQLLGSQKSQGQAADTDDNDGNETPTLSHPCPCCGGRMIIIEIFERGATPGYRPTAPISVIKFDTS